MQGKKVTTRRYRQLPKRLCGWLGVAALLFSGSVQADFARLSQLGDKGFLISAEARLLGSGGPELTLGAIEPNRQLSPASVTKAYLSAAALERFGPQHRFTSRLLSTAPVDAQGVVQGDLIFEGGGDPALTSEDLWRLVQRLQQAGVREITGGLVVSQWRFGPVSCITTDRCQAQTRVANSYSALLSSAGVNYGNWCVNVAPGAAPGEPARVTNCDSPMELSRVDNRVVTRPANSGTEISAERVTDESGDVMVLSGQISTNAQARDIYRAASDPAQQTAQTLSAMLDQAGITQREPARTTTTQPPAGAVVLAAVDGKPLQELLLRTMNYSNNFMADTLALSLVETPRAELRQAGRALEGFAETLPGHGPVELHSGSGLTTENRTSAHGVNVMLESMFHEGPLFPSFVATFQSPANGVMRFIRRGSETFQNNVMLKTGTLNQPVAVRAVGGYFRTVSGRWGVFSVLVNGTTSTPYLNWTQVLEPLAHDLESFIVAH
ncbi:D-alanyl-D-alanine carboxypeptidase/D-alanyl-D-alanine-endopeptidase [Halomonas sp. Bachu 37]|uniref:D-alanyl-D-alanine carboxypeptidase/D-alanyl-D-alanine endopeptidase n=1 Tax=Halomonas kashgarensis TaxID=3084920 RepID=UPI003216E4D8